MRSAVSSAAQMRSKTGWLKIHSIKNKV
ncbi:hypothetical protein PSP6_690075 [Paraburkholderia tropica]|nr:hypothetical protein PSP6_690075 [Paraburkholderia tropica]